KNSRPGYGHPIIISMETWSKKEEANDSQNHQCENTILRYNLKRLIERIVNIVRNIGFLCFRVSLKVRRLVIHVMRLEPIKSVAGPGVVRDHVKGHFPYQQPAIG